MYCPQHKFQIDLEENICPRCKETDQLIIDCEIDKIDRCITTMDQQGYYLGLPGDGTHAILVFKKVK